MLFNVCAGADGDQVSRKVYNIKFKMYLIQIVRNMQICLLYECSMSAF